MFSRLTLTVAAAVIGLPSASWARDIRLAARSMVGDHAQPAAMKRLRENKKRRRRAKGKRRAPRYRRHRFVQLKAGPGLHVLTPKRAWGTKLTISRLEKVMAAYSEEFPDAEPIIVHDVSGRRGGKLPPHLSHRNGEDVDIRLVHNRPTEKYRRASPRTLHKARTWFLLQALVNSCDVEVIFLDRRLQRALYRYARRKGVARAELERIFQFPKRDRNEGIVRHWKGHADHMHVRFRREWLPLRTATARQHCAEIQSREVLTDADAGIAAVSPL